MAEYSSNTVQTVNPGESIISPIPRFLVLEDLLDIGKVQEISYSAVGLRENHVGVEVNMHHIW